MGHAPGQSYALRQPRNSTINVHMTQRQTIKEALALIFQGIARLRESFGNRDFTIDGRLVGDMGEVLAALDYDITLDPTSKPDHDGRTSDGRRVQVKATFQNQLTFKTNSDYYLGLKLFADGHYEEIFNGPAKVIYARYKHRKAIGVQLLRFPNPELKRLSLSVPKDQRIPKRNA